jgi:hypothetical protein
MKWNVFLLVTMLILCGIMTACGPSPEEIATQTAAAWTPTPLPTATPTVTPSPTPTPIPYNVNVSVKNSDDEPIADALITGNAITRLDAVTDESGAASFSDLGSDSFKLKIEAPGYFVSETEQNIERGENSIEIMLERDPFSLLPSQACAPGETPLMIEDMQDQLMQGWGGLSMKLDSGAPGVEIIEDPDEPGNWLLKTSSMGKDTHAEVGTYDQDFGDAVVRFRARGSGKQHYHIGWHWTDADRYIAFVYADANGGRVEKFVGDTNFTAFNFGGYIGDGKWHFFEVSTYQGEYQIWLDGAERGKWTDKQPLPEGKFRIDQDFWSDDAYAYFDQFSVCQLSAPFQTIMTR